MFHICNNCIYKGTCRYSKDKFNTGRGQFCDNIICRKEQEDRFFKEMMDFFNWLHD